MELYIEKEFLDNFYNDFEDNKVQNIVKDIFTLYGKKRVFLNFEFDDFKILENENKIFSLISNIIPPTPINTIKDHLFNNSDFKQTLVFTNQPCDWFKDAKDKGALCFSFENYEKKIEEIINNLHFRIDLSEKFNGWSFLKAYKVLNFNTLTLTDSYILVDTSQKKICNNLIPILKTLLLNKNNKIKVDIYTDETKPGNRSIVYFKDTAIKRHGLLKGEIAKKNVAFSLINKEVPLLNNKIDFHDRNILTNFSILMCGKGFNLIPHKVSNSEITSETIFNKYTYNRLNNLKEQLEDYLINLKKSDYSYYFKMYPEQ
jgi:hypothetical protein